MIGLFFPSLFFLWAQFVVTFVNQQEKYKKKMIKWKWNLLYRSRKNTIKAILISNRNVNNTYKCTRSIFSNNISRKLSTSTIKKNGGIPTSEISKRCLQNIECFPEYTIGREALATGQRISAIENFERVLDVCSNSIGEFSDESLHLRRQILDICYQLNDANLAKTFITNMSKGIMLETNDALKATSNQQDIAADALRIGQYYLHMGEIEKIFYLEEYLSYSTAGKVCLAIASLCERDYSNSFKMLDTIDTSTNSNNMNAIIYNTLAGGHLLEGGVDGPNLALEYIEKSLDVLSPASKIDEEDRNAYGDVDDNKALEAHLFCNLGVLKLILKNPEDAMESLHASLRILENGDESALMLNNTTTGRVLAQMGAYHHITEQAVTSEGLHRGAMDNLEKKLRNPRQKLIYSHCLDLYGSLLRDWDNREVDSNKMFEEALNMREDLIETIPDDFLFLQGWGN